MLPQFIITNKEAITQIAEDNDIDYLALYGSYSRGEGTKNSDLDLLVSFNKKKGLLKLVEIEQKLSDMIGIKVDLVTKQGLNKYVKPYVQDDLKLIYAKKS